MNRYPENQRWGTWGKYIECTEQWQEHTIYPLNFSSGILSQAEDNSVEPWCDSTEGFQFARGSAGDTLELFWMRSGSKVSGWTICIELCLTIEYVLRMCFAERSKCHHSMITKACASLATYSNRRLFI